MVWSKPDVTITAGQAFTIISLSVIDLKIYSSFQKERHVRIQIRLYFVVLQ